MKYTDVLSHYKTQQAVADALQINQASIAKWVRKEAVPHLRQLQLEALSNGVLKADVGILPIRSRKRMCAGTPKQDGI